jgi:hypothetical protein
MGMNASLGSANWAAMLGYATSDMLSDVRGEGWEIAQMRRLTNEDVSIFWAVDLWKGDEFTSLIVLDDSAMQELATGFSRAPLLDAA